MAKLSDLGIKRARELAGRIDEGMRSLGVITTAHYDAGMFKVISDLCYEIEAKDVKYRTAIEAIKTVLLEFDHQHFEVDNDQEAALDNLKKLVREHHEKEVQLLTVHDIVQAAEDFRRCSRCQKPIAEPHTFCLECEQEDENNDQL